MFLFENLFWFTHKIARKNGTLEVNLFPTIQRYMLQNVEMKVRIYIYIKHTQITSIEFVGMQLVNEITKTSD